MEACPAFRLLAVPQPDGRGTPKVPARTPKASVAAAAALSASAESAATAIRRGLAGFVHGQGPAADLGPVQGRDRAAGVRLAAHLHKCEAPGASGVAIHDDLHLGHLASILLEQAAQLRLIHIERQISDIQPSSHVPLAFLA